MIRILYVVYKEFSKRQKVHYFKRDTLYIIKSLDLTCHGVLYSLVYLIQIAYSFRHMQSKILTGNCTNVVYKKCSVP